MKIISTADFPGRDISITFAARHFRIVPLPSEKMGTQRKKATRALAAQAASQNFIFIESQHRYFFPFCSYCLISRSARPLFLQPLYQALASGKLVSAYPIAMTASWVFAAMA